MMLRTMVSLLGGVVLVASSFGCAGLDLRLDMIPISGEYGALQPRVTKAKVWMVESSPQANSYTVLAKFIVQEEPTVIFSRSANEMMFYAAEQARAKGADGVIIDDVSTTNVAGGAARVSPVVKGRAIRFKGELPPYAQ